MNREDKIGLLNSICEPLFGKLKGKKMPFQSFNSYMAVFIDPTDTTCLRLPIHEYLSLSSLKDGDNPIQHGSTMKDFVIIADELLENMAVLTALVEASKKHISSLKPKK